MWVTIRYPARMKTCPTAREYKGKLLMPHGNERFYDQSADCFSMPEDLFDAQNTSQIVKFPHGRKTSSHCKACPSPIPVTKPTLPELPDFTAMLEEIWQSRYLTNMGVFHKRFEEALREYLKVKHISLFCNGTMAIQIGIKALRITGEVITTPFTFPATAHSIFWNHCTPVFCDIEPDSFGLDPEKIEPLIGPETTAIIPVHVFGRPCNLEAIQNIADIYGLKVLYDAAHAFGVRSEDGSSIMTAGDLSMVSFHATKVFNTIEGGALIIPDEKLKQRIDYLKNFGIADEVTIVGEGSNGKMNELISAYGLLQLKRIDDEIEMRGLLAKRYRENLEAIQGVTIPEEPGSIRYNHCYFPILVKQNEFGTSRDSLYEKLRSHNILARRYFYPLLSEIPCYRSLPSSASEQLPVATQISREVICLPLYADLSTDQVDTICEIIADGSDQ